MLVADKGPGFDGSIGVIVDVDILVNSRNFLTSCQRYEQNIQQKTVLYAIEYFLY